MLTNTQEFRREGLYYLKTGKYDCGVKGSMEYESWWTEQRRRCWYGYSCGGMWIPGLYYWYLNFNPIDIVSADKTLTGKKKKSGTRKESLPQFWDLDYMYWMSLHIAKYGMSLKNYKKLPISIGIKEKEENLSGGKHLLWVKPRGVGASFKGGAIAARNYHLVPESKTYMMADDAEEYLAKDGIFTKFVKVRNYHQKNNTDFASYSDVKNSVTGFHVKNSYKDYYGEEKGMMAEVIGVGIGGKPDKGRGKRGIHILFEEAGKFRLLDQTWNVSRSSVEEDGIVYGTMVAFGTGGSKDENSRSITDMAYNPSGYGILEFDNMTDAGMVGRPCCLFHPAMYGIQFTDKNGNTDLKEGEKYVDSLLEAAKKSPDPLYPSRVAAEKPKRLSDALSTVVINQFNIPGLDTWRTIVINDNTYNNLGVRKKYERDANGNVISILNPLGKPIVHYPHQQKDNLDGCVVEYEPPFKVNGVIPNNLYFICHDPYADSDAQDRTSLGAAYVLINFNNFRNGDIGDRIVASYIGRPTNLDDYNEILFMMAERWNAKIGFENERGDVVGYAKRFKKVHYLHEEFKLGWDDKIATKNPSTYKYGMRIGSGKSNIRMLTGNRYLADWLRKERTVSLANKVKYNYNYIYDRALLQEFGEYNPDNNFDRISALRIGMFMQRELLYNDIRAERKTRIETSRTRYFKHERYV